jgi:hypothetical protein
MGKTPHPPKQNTKQNLWTKDTKGKGDCRHLIERKNESHLLQKEKLERKNKPPMHRGHSNTNIHTK